VETPSAYFRPSLAHPDRSPDLRDWSTNEHRKRGCRIASCVIEWTDTRKTSNKQNRDQGGLSPMWHAVEPAQHCAHVGAVAQCREVPVRGDRWFLVGRGREGGGGVGEGRHVCVCLAALFPGGRRFVRHLLQTMFPRPTSHPSKSDLTSPSGHGSHWQLPPSPARTSFNNATH